MDIALKIKEKIDRPVAEVFAAIVNPEKDVAYGMEANHHALLEGAEVEWHFGDEQRIPAIISEIHFNQQVSFTMNLGDHISKVNILLKQLSILETELFIEEEEHWPLTKEGIRMAILQTERWTRYACDLKYNLAVRRENSLATIELNEQ